MTGLRRDTCWLPRWGVRQCQKLRYNVPRQAYIEETLPRKAAGRWPSRSCRSGCRAPKQAPDRPHRSGSFGINIICAPQVCTEYWIPAEDLDALNASIVGTIKVIAELHRPDRAAADECAITTPCERRESLCSFRRPTSGSLPPLFRRQKYLISGPSRTPCPHACLAIPRLYISVAKASVLPGVHGHLVSPDYDPYWCEGESYRPACDQDQSMRVCCP